MSAQPQEIDPTASGGAPAAFFEAAYAAYQRAEQAMGGTSDYWYRIAGFPVRLRCAGTALADRLTPALAHLVGAAATPQLTICLWDTVSTGVTMPRPPWEKGDYLTRAEIRGYNNSRFNMAYDVWGGALHILDKTRNLAIFWTHDGVQLPVYDRSSPLRMILHWWMRQYTLSFVHAGAVGVETGGVLLAGKSGSGKSTIATACLLGGLRYAGDDYCLVQTEPAPYVFSLYNSAKLELSGLRRWAPQLEALISNPEELAEEKALIFCGQHYAGQMAKEFPLRAILLPTETQQPATRLRRASAIAVLKALAPSTLVQLPGAGEQDFGIMASLAKSVPGYHLDVGLEMAQIPRVITQLLNGCEP